jgi:hypothetical protein
MEKIILFICVMCFFYLLIFHTKNFLSTLNFIAEFIFIQINKVAYFLLNSKNWR